MKVYFCLFLVTNDYLMFELRDGTDGRERERGGGGGGGGGSVYVGFSSKTCAHYTHARV